MKMHVNQSILILQKKKANETKPVEVLLANIPDFKNPNQFHGFINELNGWTQIIHKINCDILELLLY